MNNTNYSIGSCRARISIEPTGEGKTTDATGWIPGGSGRGGAVWRKEPASTGGLEAPPADFGVSRQETGRRQNSTGVYTIDLPKCDYEPMAEKAFTGRFAFYNGRHSDSKSNADTLAKTMRTRDRLLLVANANQHGKRRTKTLVRLLAAYCDGATCYVEIERA